MSHERADTVVLALRDPAALRGSSIPQWETLIRQGRRTNLLPRLALALNELGLLGELPPAPRVHLEAARTLARAQADAVRRDRP